MLLNSYNAQDGVTVRRTRLRSGERAAVGGMVGDTRTGEALYDGAEPLGGAGSRTWDNRRVLRTGATGSSTVSASAQTMAQTASLFTVPIRLNWTIFDPHRGAPTTDGADGTLQMWQPDSLTEDADTTAVTGDENGGAATTNTGGTAAEPVDSPLLGTIPRIPTRIRGLGMLRGALAAAMLARRIRPYSAT